jgi:exonuclease SbcD
MRILHTADWHLGKEWMGVDRKADLTECVIPEIVNTAVQEEVGLVVIAGDILDGFGHESLSLCAMLLRKPVKQLLDANIHVALIPGNHDNWPVFRLLDAALNINPLSEGAQLVIFTEPGLHHFDNVQVIGMPYLAHHHFKRLLAKQNIRFPVESDLQNQILSRQYESVLHAIKKRLDGRRPAVLIGHFSVSGSKFRPEDDQDQTSYAGYETSYARDLRVSREALLSSDQTPQYNALGHMHLAQSVPETVVPTCYAGSPDRFDRGEKSYQPRVLLIDLPEHGEVQVRSVILKNTTPFINEVISDERELRALADRLGQEASKRVLGDLVIQVEEITDYPVLRDEAYNLFPRLKAANTVRPETPETYTPIKFESTSDYEQIADPKVVFGNYFSRGFSEDQISHLENALDNILRELSDEN